MHTSILTRIASRHKARQASLQKTSFKQKTLLRLLGMGGTFGIMSAYTKQAKSLNQDQHGKLWADLQRMGYRKITPLRGEWGEGIAEQSVLIPNIKPRDLFALGAKYNQEATIFKAADGIVGMYFEEGKYAVIAVDPVTLKTPLEKEDTQELISKDRNWSFQFGFLWGNRVPWDGRSPVTRRDVEKVLQASI